MISIFSSSNKKAEEKGGEMRGYVAQQAAGFLYLNLCIFRNDKKDYC